MTTEGTGEYYKGKINVNGSNESCIMGTFWHQRVAVPAYGGIEELSNLYGTHPIVFITKRSTVI